MARMIVTKMVTTTMVIRRSMTSMRSPWVGHALELAPAHVEPEELLQRREGFHDVQEEDESESIEQSHRHQRQRLLFHGHRHQRGHEVEEREQDHPVDDQL